MESDVDVTTATTLTPQAYLQAQSRWHALEIAFWLATLLPFVLFPDYLSLASQIAITALFALSLDLILGYAGIVSLGHAAFFGIGAYTAGSDLEIRLGRAADRAHSGGRGRRHRRLCRELHRLALPPFHADHDHARPRPAGFRDGQQRALADRRQRRSARHLNLAGARHLQVRSLWLHRLRLFAGRAVCRVPRRAAADQFAIRPRAARHPRKLGAHAGDRRRQPRAYPQGLSRIAAAIAGLAGAVLAQTTENVSLDSHQLPALRRCAGHAGAGRRRAALWRADRRHHLHGGARPVLRHRAAILVFLDRRAAGDGGHGAAERHPRRADAHLHAVESEHDARSL